MRSATVTTLTPPSPEKSPVRGYYLFAGFAFVCGAILSIVAGSWSSLAVFLVLAAFMGWIVWRLDAAARREHDERRGRERA